MFVLNEKLDSEEQIGKYFIFEGNQYDYSKKDAFAHRQPKPWRIIEGPFDDKQEAICRMNAIWLESKEGKERQEKDRNNCLNLYYKENNTQIMGFHVCHDCKVIYWHSLRHCPFCPNKMVYIKGPANELRKYITEYRLGH
jgi:hypothetical protein